MERPTVEESAAIPETHVQETLPPSDVPFPYGTDDATSQAYGLRLPSNPDATYRETAPTAYATAPVLVTRGATTKGAKGPLVCHVEGCQRDLTLEKKYYKRYRVCMEHLKMNAIYVDGELQRFCQQCGRFHDLAKFDGDKRNCRERLSQHNQRRRKSKRDAGGSDGSPDELSSEEPSGKMQKGRRSKRLIQKTSNSPLWTSGGAAFEDGSHGMTSEEQRALGTVGMDMMHGIPVGASAGLHHPYAEGMTLTPPEPQTTPQERESLYNMVVHHVNTAAQPELASDSKVAPTSTMGVIVSGAEAVPNLSTLLQTSEPTGSQDAAWATQQSVVNQALCVQGGLGQLSPVSLAPSGNSMPAVPMLVFPSSSAPNQLSAVAIIPSATSSGSTLVPLPWQGTNQQPTSSPPTGLPIPVPSCLPVEIPVSVAEGASNEISPLVSLALSASGIAQAAGSNVYQPTFSPNQLAHFQMLMARPISMSQAPDVVIPTETLNAVQRVIAQEDQSQSQQEGDKKPKSE